MHSNVKTGKMKSQVLQPKNPLNNFVGHRRRLYKIKSFTCENNRVGSNSVDLSKVSHQTND